MKRVALDEYRSILSFSESSTGIHREIVRNKSHNISNSMGFKERIHFVV